MVVLWLITIMSMLAVSLVVQSSTQMSFIRNYRTRVAQYYLARAGIIMGIAELKRDAVNPPSVCALKDEWSNKPEIFANRNLGIGSFSVGYDYASGLKVYNTMQGEQVISSTFSGMIDEDRRININMPLNIYLPDPQNPKLSQPALLVVMQNLFQQVVSLQQDQARALAECIVDWRDPDTSKRPSGAENELYQTLPNPYDCKNAKFDVIEELMLVKGMTPSIFHTIKDYITIYGDGKVNINTAPYNSLLALGLPGTLAEKIIRCRAGTDEAEGTEDDVVFSQTGSIAGIVGGREPLNQEEVKALGLVMGLLKVNSEFFRIISIGRLNNETGVKKNSTKITCITNRNGKIMYWQEGVGEAESANPQTEETK